MTKFVANGNLYDSWHEVFNYAREHKLTIHGLKIIYHLNTIRYLILFK
jgi:hypothetical protein